MTGCSGVLVAVVLAITTSAAELKPETVAAWEQYIAQRDASNQLSTLQHEDDDRWPILRSGQILVAPAEPNIPRRVPSGLIHDWIGKGFIPNATIQQVLAMVRDYDRYKDVYRPGIVDSKLRACTGDEDRFTLRLMNTAVIMKKAIEGDYRASYVEVDNKHWYSIAKSTRVQEIEGYGSSDARLLPEDRGTGLIWRVHSITRYEQREGGVLVQIEVIVLSRDIPSMFHWVIDPIVRRISRESLELSLRQTRDAMETSLAHLVQPTSHECRRQISARKTGPLSY